MSIASGSIGYDAASSESAQTRTMSPTFRVYLLGGFRVAAEDGELPGVAWRNRKAAQLIKILALAPGYALHREQIQEILWPELPLAAASNNLRQTLHVARHRLQTLSIDPATLLRIHDERVHLSDADHCWIDVDAFEAAAREASRAGNPDVCWAAIDRYTGPLLPDDLYEDWAVSRREALQSSYVRLLVDVADLHEARGEYSSAIVALRRIIEVEPADEPAHVQLMRLYSASGHRALAFRQYRQLVLALAQYFDAVPEPATQALFEKIQRGGLAPILQDPVEGEAASRDADARLNTIRLPLSLSSFIGREREIDELCGLIAAHRLVTLTGPGCVGKTRLALEVGWKEIGHHRDGVWFADLTALTDPTLLTQTIADALGIHLAEHGDPLRALMAQLQHRDLLLILDNCEHLIAECADFVETVLANCATVRVLATSREALRLRGGHPWLVPPLPLPEPGVKLTELAANDAVRLLIDRIRWHRPDFELTADNASALTTICRRLDGLPLALELAASRAAVLALPELAVRLDAALDVLTEGTQRVTRRHQTMRAALDWSYELLGPIERILFRRVSIFPSGWNLAAAEAICSDDVLTSSAILGSLSQLVQKSLIAVEVDCDEARYHLLDLVRQYASERLHTSGEAHAIRMQHADYYLRFAENAESRLTGPGQAEWLKRVAREQDNVRGALVCFETAAEYNGALRLAAALGRFWWVQGYVTEGLQWLTRTLASATGEDASARMKALGAAFTMAHRQGDYPAALSLAAERLSLARDHGSQREIGWSLAYLGMVAVETGDEASTYLEESLAHFRLADDRAGIAEALNMLGEIERRVGNFAEATRRYEESLAIWQELGNEQYVAMLLHNLGRAAQRHGDHQRAADMLGDSLSRFQLLQINNGVALCLRGLAGVAVEIGRLASATRFLGAAEVLAERAGVVEDVVDREQSQAALTTARYGLGEARFSTIWSAVRDLPIEAIVTEALTFTDSRLFGDLALGLTPREQEVAQLVARNLTNPQIAAELGASERTIETHVSHILHKLGVASRHAIAGRIGGRGMPNLHDPQGC